MSIPKDINPALDETGRFSTQFQNDENVWFLAGTFGGTVTRNLVVPYGKAILFPIINYEACLADEPFLSHEHQLQDKCREEIDKIADLELNVDGLDIDISGYRVASHSFDIELKIENSLSVKAGKTKMASDGYWLFLRPPCKGDHTIRSFGSCLAGKVKIGCNHNLSII